MEKRAKKTKIVRTKRGFSIKFSEKDGTALAKHLNDGGTIKTFFEEKK